MSIIREYVSPSDRSAKDRARHREKVRQAIKDNIADIVADESIIGKNKDKIIKVPIRGIKEYRFVYGRNNPGAGQGQGGSQPGDVIGREEDGEGGGQQAGDQPGDDIYETEITIEELIDILFEDLALPDMEKKKLRYLISQRQQKIKGRRKKGIRPRLDKRKTVEMRIKRKKAVEKTGELVDDSEFPFHEDDLRYRHVTVVEKKESSAVVICIMDTSGSMDTMKKYLARSFYFLLYQFVKTKYQNVDLVFIAHHTEAKEVTEDEFFHKGESGGTYISSGYKRALEIIYERYNPNLWNIYAFHCSDGDNWSDDNDNAIKYAKELCDVSNLFGYGEIKPDGKEGWGSMLELYEKKIDADNFATVKIRDRKDVYPMFKALLKKEKIKE